MVIIKVMGGLGNQLQQYALYQKFCSIGKEAYLDLSWFSTENQEKISARRSLEITLFDNADYNEATLEQISEVRGTVGKVATIKNKIIRKLAPTHSRIIEEDRMYYPNLLDMDNVYLEGYWAAEIYYADILPLLRDKLRFDETQLNKANKDMLMQITGDNRKVHTCSIHLRRGDYLDPVNQAIFGNIATDKYYESAYTLVRKNYPDTRFYVFSDEPDYARERFGEESNCIIVDNNHGLDSRFDILLMSKCMSHICANSTFSFWGSRLSEYHEVNIRPTIQKNSQSFDLNLMSKLWKGWQFISPEGVHMNVSGMDKEIINE